MALKAFTPDLRRPSIRSVPFTASLFGVHRLSRSDREHLGGISTVLRLDARTVICRRGEPAGSLYNIACGTARAYRVLAHGKRRGLAFLFSGDLFGLGEKGFYVNTVEAVTAVTLFKIPIETLTALLLRDADLQFHFLCKAAHALRETQRQAIVIGRRDPVDRLAMFLSILEETAADETAGRDWIQVPMSLQDIAEFVNLPIPTVDAALKKLEHDRVVERRHNGATKILDRRKFNRLLAGA